jgi:hypothetical protein
MISTETPDKLRVIIMDTWPNLYYLKRDDWKSGTRGERDESKEIPER